MPKREQQTLRRELRIRGWLLRAVLPSFSERFFRMAGRVIPLIWKGRWFGRLTEMETRGIPRADGGTLRLCICRAKTGARTDATGLLWLHGGGYAMGLPELEHSFLDALAGDGGCVAVVPDYRLSVDAPFPAALEDAYAALVYMQRHARELGIREDQLFVGGDSAGGGLAVALLLYARDKGQVSVAFSLPLYPMLDDRTRPAPLARGDRAPVWDRRSNEAAWRLYLGDAYGTDAVCPYAAPARATDYSGLPPVCTFVGTAEPFYDETAALVSALEAQGIPVRFRAYEGCFHAFDRICPRTRAAKDADAFLLEAFRHAQACCFAGQPHAQPV